jgi:hypothetical protein
MAQHIIVTSFLSRLFRFCGQQTPAGHALYTFSRRAIIKISHALDAAS